MIKLDMLDKKILNQLNIDPRAQYSDISKKVRASKEVVQYRINRMIENGLIKNFVTIIGLGYWAHKILVQFEKIGCDKEKEIIDYLIKNNNTNWVTPCTGNWDLVFAIMAKNPEEFDIYLREIIGKIGKYIHNYKMAISIGSSTFGHTYLLKSVKEDSYKKRSQESLTLNEKDKKICRLLHKDARIKLSEISRKTNIPIDTVKYRMKKMKDSGIIKRYRLILDPTKLGYNRYEIFIRCVNLTDRTISRMKEFMKQHHNVEYFSKCTGAWDVELTVNFKENQELRNFVLEVKENFGEYIQNFESIVLFETYNYIYFPKELRSRY